MKKQWSEDGISIATERPLVPQPLNTHPPSPGRVHRPTTCADVAPPQGCPRPGLGWERAPASSRPGLVAIFRSVLSRECCSPGSQASVSYRGQFLTPAAQIPEVPPPAGRPSHPGGTAGAGPNRGRGQHCGPCSCATAPAPPAPPGARAASRSAQSAREPRRGGGARKLRARRGAQLQAWGRQEPRSRR
ncbi:CDC42 small effector protein 2 isoform X1 [Trachypithecus francoisi]|uniref:CDC42 small effector protein 2 isoform X1 n=1 Tax=Trachypithecus francoisi TaxID=54180 RepID=UPI00141A8D79|nr:CDC42 small effector protein 2 isoform X1 [Trachypithecus francoisi]XP_033037228.1 CDC42 small effector protein 2 isoform X1 [Trachypithecus francoisi]